MVHRSATSTVACTGPTQWLSIASSVGQRVGVENACRKAVDAVGNDFGAHQPVDGKLWQIIILDLLHEKGFQSLVSVTEHGIPT